MQTTGIYNSLAVTLKISSVREKVTIVPVGDTHMFSPTHAEKEFDRFCVWAKKHPKTYYILVGDMCDFASASERKGLTKHSVHESTVSLIENIYRTQAQTFVDKTSFMAGRIIALLDGNHRGEFRDGTTTGELMASMYNTIAQTPLPCTYLGSAGMVRVTLDYHDKRFAFDFLLYHGSGAARTKGGSLRGIEQMRRVGNANVYVAGHNHDKGAWDDAVLELHWTSKGKIKTSHVPILYVRSGSYLRGYVENHETYVADRLYPPQSLGSPKITLGIRWNGSAHLEKTLSGASNYDA